jgi:lysophospholipase L1-like esterase
MSILYFLIYFSTFLIVIYFFRNSIIQNIYKLPFIRKSWQLPNMDAHSVNLINNDKPVVVCCGDSITHGHIGYDWVSSLRDKDDSKIYINAGINADLTWNLNQRLDDIIKHNPDYITILIGTNDAIGSQPVKLIQDYYIQTKNLPQVPSIEWFEEQIEIFVKEVKENTSAKIAITTLPWLGEQKDASVINVIKNHNKIIKRIAVQYDLFILDLFSKFKEQIASNDSIPYTNSELRRLRGLRAVILYYIFGWSWTKIGKKYKLKLLCDHIHLNEKGGDLMEQLAKEFLSS